MDDYLITSFKQELFYHNESPEEDGSKNYVTQNQLSNQKTSLIRIDDTPSPVQGRKLTKDLKKQRSHKKSSSKKQVKKAILGVSESPNRIRKLLNPSANFDFNENDTLPGGKTSSDEDIENSPMPYKLATQQNTARTQVIPRTQLTPLTQNVLTQQSTQRSTVNTPKTQKTPSSLFKPKAKLNSNQEEEENGCDLSFGSLKKLQRKRQNPYIVRLSEIFTSFAENLSSTNQDKSSSQVLKSVSENNCQSMKSNQDTQQPNTISGLLSDMVNSYFNESQYFTSFTRVSMLSQDSICHSSESQTHISGSQIQSTGSQIHSSGSQIQSSESQIVIKTEPTHLNETSRFEYTIPTNASKRANQIQIGDAFNLSSLLSSLEIGSQSTQSSQKSNLSHIDEDEESQIVIHQPILNSQPNSLMCMLLEKIDQVFATLKRLNAENNGAQNEVEPNEDTNRISKIFSNKEAQNIDSELISQFQSLKNNAGGNIPILSQSILNSNTTNSVPNKNLVSGVLTDMLTSYFSETQMNFGMQINQFDSTKITEENRVIKEEIETPDLTDIDEFDEEPVRSKVNKQNKTQELFEGVCSHLSQLAESNMIIDIKQEITDDLSSQPISHPGDDTNIIKDTPAVHVIKQAIKQEMVAEITDDLSLQAINGPNDDTNVIKDTPVDPTAMIVTQISSTSEVTSNSQVTSNIEVSSTSEVVSNSQITTSSEPSTLILENLNKERLEIKNGKSSCTNGDPTVNKKSSDILESSKQLKKNLKKKLLDPNRFVDEDSLPGSPTGTSSVNKPLDSFRYTQKAFTPKVTPSLFKPKSDLPIYESSKKVNGKKLATQSVVLGKPPIPNATPNVNKNKTTLSQKLSDLADDSSLDLSEPFSDKMIETPNAETKRLSKNHLSRQIFNKELEKALTKSEKSLKPKKFVIAHLNLKSAKLNELKETISIMNDVNSDSSDSELVQIQASQQKVFNLTTTHLIVDFESTFDNKEYDLKTKLIIILAVLNKCKIIRHEWLVHSKTRLRWQDETKYLLDNYLSEDLSEYEEEAFDIQVVRLIRNLHKQKSKNPDIFTKYKNVFLIKERSENNSKLNTEFDDVLLFEKKSTLQTYLAQIITKCGGEIKNKIEEAEFMIAVDKTNDYDEEIPNQLNKIRLDRSYFVECVKKLNTLVTNTIDVVSSEWVLDCILENSDLEREDYNLISLVPEN